MLDPNLIPTPLLHATERLAVGIVKELPPPQFLVTRTCFRLLGWTLHALWLRVTAGTPA